MSSPSPRGVLGPHMGTSVPRADSGGRRRRQGPHLCSEPRGDSFPALLDSSPPTFMQSTLWGAVAHGSHPGNAYHLPHREAQVLSMTETLVAQREQSCRKLDPYK